MALKNKKYKIEFMVSELFGEDDDPYSVRAYFYKMLDNIKEGTTTPYHIYRFIDDIITETEEKEYSHQDLLIFYACFELMKYIAALVIVGGKEDDTIDCLEIIKVIESKMNELNFKSESINDLKLCLNNTLDNIAKYKESIRSLTDIIDSLFEDNVLEQK